MTITLTKPVRVGGVELAAATTQTFAADVEADLISRGAATPVFLAPGAVAPGANHISEHRQLGGVANQIAAIGTPFVILPGDGAAVGMFFTGTAGAFTLSAAILTNAWNLLKGAWCYMPASFGGSAYPAGWYWAVFSGDTDGTLYVNTYSSRVPVRPASPTNFPVNLSGRLNQTTSEITGPAKFLIPGGALGPNGAIKAYLRTLGSNGATNKYLRLYLDATQVGQIGTITTNPNAEYLVSIRNQGSEALQCNSRTSYVTGVGSVGGTVSGAPEYSSVDTGSDKSFSISLQNNTNTGSFILLHADATVTYGA
jgi:hypothetical protein